MILPFPFVRIGNETVKVLLGNGIHRTELHYSTTKDTTVSSFGHVLPPECTFPRMMAMPMKTVATTTATLARKRTKVPTELMAATRITFDTSILKARRAAEQKL